jgi:hypothetical protein
MHGHGPSTLQGDRVKRRGFPTVTGIASATTILSVAPVGRLA